MNSDSMLQQGWKYISCGRHDLNINFVLCSGQSFRWKETDGIWTGVHSRKVWQLRQDETKLWYKVLNQTDTTPNADLKSVCKRKRKNADAKSENEAKCVKFDENCNEVYNAMENAYGTVSSKNLKDSTKTFLTHENFLTDYFQLKVDLESLCKTWCAVDSHFKHVHDRFPGVRMLRQDPVENLFSFICSSNNNITRISSMVEKMCVNFGELIHSTGPGKYFAFPTIDKLAGPNTESVLRGLGFGYRAKYIHQTAIQVQKNGGDIWLHNLRSLSYEEAHSELVKLPGIGAKVADCICMMSLDKPEAIPVDTHVWQIAVRDYKITSLKNTKTLTNNAYKSIGQFFRSLWGNYASWAMNFLFVADLKQFQKLAINNNTKKETKQKHSKG